MKISQTIFQTNKDINGLLIRFTLALVLLPHGLQMTIGSFGGNGFEGTMNYFTGTLDLPWLIAFLVIMLQSAGALLILLGAGTRLMAVSIFFLFTGMIFTTHLDHGFFMNWNGDQKGEGFEFHLLVLGLSLLLLHNGAGPLSVDSFISKMLSRKKGSIAWLGESSF